MPRCQAETPPIVLSKIPEPALVAPRTTPVEIVEKLYLEINEGLADPNIAARLADAGVTILALSREEFGKFVINETEKWAKVIRAANLRPD